MNSFSDFLQNWDKFNFENFLKSRTENNVLKVLNKESISYIDFLTLLSPISDNFLEEMAQKSREITTREFGKTIQIYTPLYISNYCVNRCVYCGFNRENKIIRSKLSIEDAIEESKLIHKLGIRHILLLTGGDRKNSSLDYIKSVIKAIKSYFDSISIEMYAMEKSEYAELIELGVDNITIYQETYSRQLYSKYHLAGEKMDYDYRLETPERAAKAGIKSVNFGALLGLDIPIVDFFKASIHSDYIMNKYPGCNVGISLPRIRDAIGDFKVTEPLDDKLFCKMIMAYRIFNNKGTISISTRESESFRNNLIPLGVNKMSAESKTTVGGHIHNHSEPQFEISDRRTVKELESYLVKKGYQPVYKDWVIV